MSDEEISEEQALRESEETDVEPFEGDPDFETSPTAHPAGAPQDDES